MERRDYLKLMLAGSLGTGFILTTSCTTEDIETSGKILEAGSYGRNSEEMEHDKRLSEGHFFTEQERKTVEVLCNIIIPADEISGSAVDAGVPEFIEFMMKDFPLFQIPTRGGLMWLNNRCSDRFGKSFSECTESEQLEVINEIAWPEKTTPDTEYGIRFFNRMRNLTATGFFTSQMGITDLGYAGNRANFWDGVPEDVLEKHGLSYDQKTLDECIKSEDRTRIAEWDADGNLL